MISTILSSPYALPLWAGLLIGIPAVGVAGYYIVLFVKDKFGTK
jgi:hypothetical protein